MVYLKLDRAIDFAESDRHSFRILLNGESALKRLSKSDSHVLYSGHRHKKLSKQPIRRIAIDPYNSLVREESNKGIDEKWIC